MTLDNRAVAERLAHLERDNRRLKHGAVLFVLLAASVTAMAAVAPPNRPSLEAREFVLRDDTGAVRARLGFVNNGRQPAFEILDEQRVVRIRLTAGSTPVIAIMDDNGGKLPSTIVGSSGVQLNGAGDVTRGLLQVGKTLDPRQGTVLGEHVSLNLFGADGKSRLALGVDHEDHGKVQVRDGGRSTQLP